VPQRLWQRVCELSEIEEQKIWAELPHRNLNKLIELLIRCPFEIQGKTTFKEEFVTCGGVDLKEIDLETMESKKIKNLFFAGEVLNIDGETGGFNFQAAWSTAYIAAQQISK
jgi:predicted Rossmann fold flavoprotein